MVVTARDGTILEANRAASEMFDWPHDRFLGMNVLDVYADREDRARYQERIEREGYVRDYEVVFVTRDRRRLDCLLTNVVRRAADGSVLGYQSIVRDVTEARRLAAELVAIQDRERRRIASGLHDGACQTLAVARMKIEDLRQADEEQRQPLLDYTDGLLERTMGELRTLVFDLSPPELHHFGLVAALHSLAGQLDKEHGLRVALECEGDCEVAEEGMRDTLFRCLRELLLNVVRHAGTDAAAVSLRRDKTGLSLAVVDRGRGFDPSPEDPRPRTGYGLFSIGECLRQAGGSFDIQSTPGQGTRCVLAIPAPLLEKKESSR